MGSLDSPVGTNVKRKIQLVNVTGKTPQQIETFYNDGPGIEGWRIIQIIEVGSARYIVAEKEL